VSKKTVRIIGRDGMSMKKRGRKEKGEETMKKEEETRTNAPLRVLRKKKCFLIWGGPPEGEKARQSLEEKGIKHKERSNKMCEKEKCPLLGKRTIERRHPDEGLIYCFYLGFLGGQVKGNWFSEPRGDHKLAKEELAFGGKSVEGGWGLNKTLQKAKGKASAGRLPRKG